MPISSLQANLNRLQTGAIEVAEEIEAKAVGEAVVGRAVKAAGTGQIEILEARINASSAARPVIARILAIDTKRPWKRPRKRLRLRRTRKRLYK
jgi:hypothetical protein